MTKNIAVIGAGWAGLSAAVRLAQRGVAATVFEAAPQPGGRARTVRWRSGGDTLEIDNGQHILIGAYRQSLAMMQTVGVDLDAALQTMPFGLPQPGGWKLKAANAPAPFHLVGALLRSGYAGPERRQLMTLGLRVLRGIRQPGPTVQEWLGDLRGPVWDEMIEPLCVAALNTPATDACAFRFCFALRQALLGRASASRFLIPLASLSQLFAGHAMQWLEAAGVAVQLNTPVKALVARDDCVFVGDRRFDAAIVATSPHVAGGLVNQAALQTRLADLRYEPIATCTLRLDPSTPFSTMAPMLALPPAAADTPAGHWLFHRMLPMENGGAAPALAVVTSAARLALAMPRDEWVAAIIAQVRRVWPQLPEITDRMLIVEKRATFSCVPHAGGIAQRTAHPRIFLAGDYTEAHLPATLEAAVISGKRAAELVI
jgi:hydroxysqualene dehydroxylase